MAKITIVGDALVVTSSKSLDDIKLLEKYRPKALSLYEVNDEGVKEEAFSVSSTKGSGSINQYGASFGGTTHDEAKLATITMSIPYDIEDAVEYAADKVGFAVVQLNKVEAQIDTAIAEVAVEKAAVLANIEIAQ